MLHVWFLFCLSSDSENEGDIDFQQTTRRYISEDRTFLGYINYEAPRYAMFSLSYYTTYCLLDPDNLMCTIFSKISVCILLTTDLSKWRPAGSMNPPPPPMIFGGAGRARLKKRSFWPGTCYSHCRPRYLYAVRAQLVGWDVVSS
jgi:hypothetical protein